MATQTMDCCPALGRRELSGRGDSRRRLERSRFQLQDILGKAEPRGSEKVRGKAGRDVPAALGGLWGSDPALREAVMLETCPHTVVQTHRMRSTKHDPRCELWASGDNDVST